MDGLQRRIQIARGDMPADLVLRNARLVNVCSGECYPADIAIADGFVVGVSAPGDGYQGREERNLQGRWLAPGSSMVTCTSKAPCLFSPSLPASLHRVV